MKDNRGISIISLILTILIFILIGFICYEVFYVDIFDINNVEVSMYNETQTLNKISQEDDKNHNIENISTVEPIINNNNLRKHWKFI